MAIYPGNLKSEYRMIGVFASSAAFIADVSSSYTAREGDAFYNTATNQLNLYNGSTWVAVGGAAMPLSLDGSAQVGAKITNVDQVEIERSYASGAVLVLDQNNTGASAVCLDIENASNDAASISVDFTSTNGFDIDGTSSSWSVSYQGNAIFNAVDLNDGKSLKFGSSDDVTANWDGSNLLIEALADDTGQIRIGSTNSLDLSIYGSTNTNIALWDVSTAVLELNGWDVNLQDDDILQFGDSNDITITWDQTKLAIDGAAADTVIAVGQTNNQDVIIYGDTSTDAVTFDTSAEDVQFNGFDLTIQDGDLINFGDGDDVTMSFDGTNFEIFAAAADTPLALGGTTNGFDLTYYFETAGTIAMDYDADVMTFDACDLALGDDDYLLLGDAATAGGTTDGTIRWDATADNIEIIGDVDITGTLTVSGAFDIGNFAFGDNEELRFGNSNDFVLQYDSATSNMAIDAAAANDGIDIGLTVNTDVIFHGGTATYDCHWDASANTLAFLDDAVLSFGGSAASPDMTIMWDQTRLNIGGASGGTGSQIRFGADDEGVDVLFYGETANAQMLWDESADQLVIGDSGASVVFQDNAALLLGTGTTNAGDFSISSDGTDLLIAEIASAGKVVKFGVSGKGLDLIAYGDTAGRDLYWDQSANQLELKDDALLAFGSSDDVTLAWDQTKLVIEAAAADSAISIGKANNMDLVIYGDTSTDAVTFDTSAESVDLNGFDLSINDDDLVKFGDADDITMTWDQSKFVIDGAAADTVISIGKTNNQDIVIYGDTTTDAVTFDTSAEDIDINGFDISINDDDLVKFGDADDITITWDQTVLVVDGAAADTVISIGKTNNQDIVIYGDTTTDAVTFDTSAEDIQLNGFDLTLQDDDILNFGDADDVQIFWDKTQLQIDGGPIFIGDQTNYVTISSAGVLTADPTGNSFGGLCIPQHATSSPSGTPGTGAIFFEVDASKLWVHKGAGSWVGTVLS